VGARWLGPIPVSERAAALRVEPRPRSWRLPAAVEFNREEEGEEEFFNHYKNNLERHAHTPSGG